MNKKKSKWSAVIREVFCPRCGERQPMLRKPRNFRQFLWGGSTCNACGCEMDKFGKEVIKKP